MRTILLLMLLCASAVPSFAQFSLSQAIQATGLQKEATDGIHAVSDKSVHFLQKKYEKMTASVEKQSGKMLARMQRKEGKLERRVRRTDSIKAADLFAGADETYQELKSNLKLPFDSTKQFPLTEYVPGIDSMQTALSFLKEKGVNLPPEKLAAIAQAGNELKAVQDKLQRASDVETFVKQRERQLKEQLGNSGVAKQLKRLNKEAFYYGQRLREYKDALRSPEKMAEKVLGAVRGSKLFQAFMQKHSYLSVLFPSMGENNMPQSLAGLQTRAGVQQQLQQRFGAGAFSGSTSTSGSNSMQQQMQAAQSQLSQLRNRLNQSGITGASSDMTMPDFKPNTQHTKTFLQRLEYGLNMQSEKNRSILPATSELALTSGYKLNEKSTIGLGISYRVGWGTMKHISLSSEGLGLRSYLDIKAKGSLWISGGYEMNYMQSFTKYQQLYDVHVWQRSGLIGLKKKYKVGKKENNIQILWDFLSYRQTPKTQALKFRLGFNL